MNCKLYAVVNLRAALGAKIWVEGHICREGNGGAVKGLFIQDNETFHIVHQIRHRYQQLLVFGEGAEIIIEGSHPLHFLWSFLKQNPCPSYDAKLAKASQNCIK
uniref:CKX3 n=1 Tax=Arundo donax TaxID=35708 RepID=A0A0A9GZX8_ARUDO